MTLHKWYWQYNPINLVLVSKEYKMQSKIKWPCDLTIANRSFALWQENDVITKDVIKNRCECTQKNTCIRIVELLNSGKWSEAEELLITIKSNKCL